MAKRGTARIPHAEFSLPNCYIVLVVRLRESTIREPPCAASGETCDGEGVPRQDRSGAESVAPLAWEFFPKSSRHLKNEWIRQPRAPGRHADAD